MSQPSKNNQPCPLEGSSMNTRMCMVVLCADHSYYVADRCSGMSHKTKKRQPMMDGRHLRVLSGWSPPVPVPVPAPAPGSGLYCISPHAACIWSTRDAGRWPQQVRQTRHTWVLCDQDNGLGCSGSCREDKSRARMPPQVMQCPSVACPILSPSSPGALPPTV